MLSIGRNKWKLPNDYLSPGGSKRSRLKTADPLRVSTHIHQKIVEVSMVPVQPAFIDKPPIPGAGHEAAILSCPIIIQEEPDLPV